MTRSPAAALACVALVLTVAPVQAAGEPAASASGQGCTPGPMPYDGLPGAELRPEVHVSEDPEPVPYVLWRGTVPGFDGMPFSVDVTVPCGSSGPQPTVVMAHGFTDDKTVWEETGKSDTGRSIDRPGSNDRWNNIWFAGRGYTVLNYTARGWRDSCGPDVPGHTAEAPAPQCAPHEYWIHLDDMRWEVRDVQWLTGGLVQSGAADPDRLAITGGSYGGGPASMGALLGGRTMCGGAPVPTELGPDPCAGRSEGDLVPWTTPDGETDLLWAASIPLYTFGDLVQVLAPNGRGTDGWDRAPPAGDTARPVGSPLQSTVSGLLLVAGVYGRLAPPGADRDSDITTSADRLLAGNPFPPDDPDLARDIRLYREFKSPITIDPVDEVPIFWVQGLTDALFPALEALAVREHVLEVDPAYPFKVFLGDLGHDYAAERQDEWDIVKPMMNEFIDHHLRPDRTPEPPAFDVTATVTRCLDDDAPVRAVTAPDWHDLHREHRTFTSSRGGRTSTTDAGPAGAATDPISTATLPGDTSYKGCRIMRPSERDPTVATYEFPLDEDLELMGGPVVDVGFSSTGPDVPLSVRVWDVAPDRSRQGLVTRGTWRMDGPGGSGQRAEFQLAVQGYRFPAGHRLKVEVTANDAPYLQASSIPAEVEVERLSITMPLLTEGPPDTGDSDPEPTAPADGEPTDGEDAATDGPSAGSDRSPLPWIGLGVAAVGVLAVGALWLVRRRRP